MYSACHQQQWRLRTVSDILKGISEKVSRHEWFCVVGGAGESVYVLQKRRRDLAGPGIPVVRECPNVHLASVALLLAKSEWPSEPVLSLL